ncbi:MAG TPA: hypothetical protein VEQ58_12595 [Polyangiaceae bacterium]|nr:hypothetical protein [Polyangiaceae bacterium]
MSASLTTPTLSFSELLLADSELPVEHPKSASGAQHSAAYSPLRPPRTEN